jgi:hypothetical protein
MFTFPGGSKEKGGGTQDSKGDYCSGRRRDTSALGSSRVFSVDGLITFCNDVGGLAKLSVT